MNGTCEQKYFHLRMEFYPLMKLILLTREGTLRHDFAIISEWFSQNYMILKPGKGNFLTRF